MSKQIDNMNEEAARAFATDAYRQLGEMTRQRDELLRFAEYAAYLNLGDGTASPTDTLNRLRDCAREAIAKANGRG